MLRRALFLVALSVSSCAEHRGLLRHGPTYELEDAPYRIGALPDGSLMPPGWRLENYVERGGVLRLKLPTDFRDLHFTREVDDGTLNVVTRELRERETKQELHELVNHAMEDFRDPVWNGDKWVAGTLFQTVRPVLKEPVPGCEAVDVVMDARPSDVATSTTRMYVLWMRPKSRATITTVVYENLIGTFAPAIDDVLGLVERWSCK